MCQFFDCHNPRWLGNGAKLNYMVYKKWAASAGKSCVRSYFLYSFQQD